MPVEVRQPPTQILASLIAQGKKVVFLTGAGLSAASGIPTFRGQEDSIWVQRATSWGTKGAFLRDPVKWYNTFWFPYFPMKFTKMVPNGGHEALAKLANLSPRVGIVTQNIDTLSQQTREAWNHAEQLIEVHGRMGIYHCSSEEPCDLATELCSDAVKVFGEDVAKALDSVEGSKVEITSAPLCPCCKSWPMMPLALMFDEDYTSHAIYQFDRAMAWFEQADAIAFVGTSFSVQITSLALTQARERDVPVFNFNLASTLKGQRRYTVYNVVGPAEETLGSVVDAVMRLQAAQQPSPLVCHVSKEQSAADATEAVMMDETPAEPAPSSSSSSAPPYSSPAPSTMADVKPPPSYELDHTCTLISAPLQQSDVVVDLSPAYGRKINPDPRVEEGVGALWTQLLTTVPSAFNGLKFRLAGAVLQEGSMTAVSADREKRARTGEGYLVLRVWLTDYRAFRGTNWSPHAAALKADGLRDCGDSDAYLAHKIGVSAVLVTSDERVVLVQRSSQVAEGGGLFDVPGGHPEPSHVGFMTLEGASPAVTTPEAVCREIFESAALEVRDEVNLPREQMSDPLLLGIVRQNNSGGCPSLAFVIHTPCTAQQVEAAYLAGPKEAFETTRLVCVTVADMAAGNYPGILTPSAEGSLVLFMRLAAGVNRQILVASS